MEYSTLKKLFLRFPKAKEILQNIYCTHYFNEKKNIDFLFNKKYIPITKPFISKKGGKRELEEYVAIDFETANARLDSACSVGLAIFEKGKLIDTYYTLINPKQKFSWFNIRIHGLTSKDVKNAPTFADIFPTLKKLISGRLVVSHTNFDIKAIEQASRYYSLPPLKFNYFDSCTLSRSLVVSSHHRLKDMARHFHYYNPKEHNALEDAKACGFIILGLLKENKCSTITELIHKARYPYFGYFGPENKHKFIKYPNRKTLQYKIKTKVNYNKFNGLTKPDKYNLFFGRNVVFTGTLKKMSRAKAFQYIKNLGGIPQKTLTRRTNCLVIGYENPHKVGLDGKSKKLRQAERINQKTKSIKIINENSFSNIIAKCLQKNKSN